MARKPLSKRTRFEVFKRDGFKCQYCGSLPSERVLHVDHIVAVANGGGNEINNLVTSCEACNLGKSSVLLSVIPESINEMATRIAEQEEQIRGYHEVMRAQLDRIENQTWEVAETLDPGCSEAGFNKARLQSIKTFLKRIDFFDVLEAAEITIAKRNRFSDTSFRYFCGVCWSKIREREHG